MKNIEAEKNLLGCLLIDGTKINEISGKIKPEDFYLESHQDIFTAMLQLETIDLVSLAEKLGDKSDSAYLTSLAARVPSTSSIDNYVNIIVDLSKKRWLGNLFATIGKEEKPADEIIKNLSLELISQSGTEEEKPDIKDLIRNYEEYQNKNQKAFLEGKKFLGIETGFGQIDEASSGMQEGLVYLWNAYTGVGKTWAAINIANSVLMQNKRIVFFSLEMGTNAVVGRLLAVKSGINSLSLATGKHQKEKEEMDAKAELYESKLKVYRGKRYLDDILHTMLAEHNREPVDLFIIDYIQHVKVRNKNRYETYTDTSNDFQNMATRLKVPILELSQIDNATARSRDSKVIGAKGSGDIAGDAQFVVLIQDDEEGTRCYKDKFKAVNFIVQKNTYGEKTGKFEMVFDKRNGRYFDADKYNQISNLV